MEGRVKRGRGEGDVNEGWGTKNFLSVSPFLPGISLTLKKNTMIIAISGSTGFVGQALVRRLAGKGYTLRAIDRSTLALPEEAFRIKAIEGADVVVNLAGATVSRRWTPSVKEEIYQSRIRTTQKIVTAIQTAEKRPALFISASAVGIYSENGIHPESSQNFSDSFLAKVCTDWEREAKSAPPEVRTVIFRIGVVLGRDGGALAKLKMPFQMGVGGKIGNGKQMMSFIHLDDLVDALLFAIENPDMRGVYNAVSPFPVANGEFTTTLGKVFKQPAFVTIPAIAMKMMLGEGAQILLEGQHVLPERLTQAGFRFKYPTIQNALMHIYRG